MDTKKLKRDQPCQKLRSSYGIPKTSLIEPIIFLCLFIMKTGIRRFNYTWITADAHQDAKNEEHICALFDRLILYEVVSKLFNKEGLPLPSKTE